MANQIHQLYYTGANALLSQQAIMNTIGKNVSNANTPGYSRQRLNLIAVATPGMGVQVGELEGLRDAAVQKKLLGLAQGLGFQQGKFEVLRLAEPALNDLDGHGVSAGITRFFDALALLANDPSGIVERQEMLAAGESLGHLIHDAAEGIEDARQEAIFESQAVVERVNILNKKIASLNHTIALAENTPTPESELKDNRDLLLTELSELVGIETVNKADGTITVFLSSGGTLVDDQLASKMKLVGGGPTPLSFEVIKADGSVSKPLGTPGGRLGGLFEARDSVLTKAASQLDDMAFGMVTAVNGVHQAGFALDGSTGNDFFESIAGVAGAAFNVSLSATVKDQPNKIAGAQTAAMVPGDNANILVLLALQDDSTVVTGGKTIGGAYDETMSTVTVAQKDARIRAEEHQQRVDHFDAERDAVSGVSLQEEMINLAQAERAFEAASRLVEAASDMFDTVLRLI